MANVNPNSLPLYQKISRRNTTQRSLDITIFFLLVSLLAYRLLHIKSQYGFAWLLAFLCESWFTFLWVLTINIKWSPVECTTYLEHLEHRELELPPVDLFVTTADPVLEPPIITVNTVLSLLAIDYPSNRLACYVSDDGCSPLTYYSLVEASKFAKLWVPFCKKYNVQIRAPFRYFLTETMQGPGANSQEFQQEWKKIKDEYQQLSGKLEHAAKIHFPCELTEELSVFSHVERGNHSTIIKILWENKDLSNVMSHLIYISREKRPNHPHNYKAGAMNILTRVSGLMTNAPFILNVDCDMFANNPQIARHAMCFVFGSSKESDCGFIQSPQLFYDSPENGINVLNETMGCGIVGIQGPFYYGSGCFHRRKAIYGLWPDDVEDEGRHLTSAGNEELADEKLMKEFGNSKEFAKSAAEALKGKADCPNSLSNSIEAAYQVAGCSYEYGSGWGTKFGWIYGSTSEDINTGLKIQARGWRTLYNTPNPPAFLGCAPPGGPDSMGQQRRWAAGLFEILVSRNNPIFSTLYGKLQLRQCLAYFWTHTLALRSIPELCYAALPAYCIITNSNFLPKVYEPVICVQVSLFVIYNLYTLSDYLRIGLSIRIWWVNQRMSRIFTTSAWLFGFFDVILKLLGLSETVFIVTRKGSPSTSTSNDGTNDPNAGKFIFDESSYFVPGTTILLVNLTALVSLLLRLQPPAHDGRGSGLGEVICSLWVVLSFWPFLKGLFEKGKYGIPLSTICKSAVLALFFVQLFKKDQYPKVMGVWS